MKKFLSKIAILLTTLALAFSLIGCDGCAGGAGTGGTGGTGGGQTPPQPEGPDISYVQPDEPSITMLSVKNLTLGESFILTPTKKNISGDFVWSSSDPTVASVDGGVVRALKIGKTEITASIGETFAKCEITVAYGDFKPELLTYSNFDESGITISNTGSVNIFPYVLYNGMEFSDGTFSYSSDNTSVVTVANGVITAVGNGNANVTITANWRDFNSTDDPLLSKTIPVCVKDDVTFNLDGAVAGGFVIETPAFFIPESEHKNVQEFTPTVTVNGGAPVAVEEVILSPVGDIVEGVDYTFEKVGTKYVYTALGLGDSLITLKYQLGDDIHSANFYISAVRPTMTIADTVQNFNVKEGTIKVEKGGKMVTSNLVKEYFNEGAVLYDAYEDAKPLAFTSNGEVLNVAITNQNSYGHSVITLGTKTEILEFSLRTAGHFMYDKEDVYSALVASPYSQGANLNGYFAVMNDIDMEGIAINASGIGSFNGVFDGRGKVISNLVSDTTTKGDVRGGGLFSFLRGSIKNVAFVNLKGIQNSSRSYVGLIAKEFHSGSFENVYIDINPETVPEGIGLFYNIGTVEKVTFQNTIINYPCSEDFVWNNDKYVDWCESQGYFAGKGVLGQGIAYYSQSGNKHTLNTRANMNNLFVLSPMPLFHGSPARVPDGYSSKVDSTDWFLYAENETKLWYQHSYLDTFYPDHEGEHTVASAGEIVGKEYQFRVNEKVRVVSGVRRYDDMSALVADTSEQMTKNLDQLAELGYFVLVDGAPVWHSLVDEYTTVTASGEKIENNSFEIDCYQDTVIDVKALVQNADSVTLSESSDLISINGTKVVAEKVGNGAILTVNYTWGKRTYVKTVTVNVLNPFILYADDNAVDKTYSKLLGSTVDLKVKIGDVEVENVTFSENVDGLSISNSTLSVDKVVENAEVKASFTYKDTQYEVSMLFSTIDPVSLATNITVDGEDVDGVAKLNISAESLIALKLDGKTPTITSITIDSDKFEVNGDKVTAVGYGSAQMVIIFDVDGTSHKKVIGVETAYTTENITDCVDYDADEGLVKANYQGSILEAEVVYNGSTVRLTKENGGIVEGALYSMISKDDVKFGVPYVNATSKVKEMAISLYTTNAVYNFEKVNYNTFVIETAEEYERAFDYGDYNYEGIGNGTFEYKLHDGIYVLANDIDMTGYTIENRIDYLAFTGEEYKISSSNVGFSGTFDGRGHTVSNAKLSVAKKYTYVDPGEYGNIPSGHKNQQSYGLFHSVLKGAVIKNVAYTNVLATTSGSTNSLTGILARAFNGTLENVYIDINPQTSIMKGVAFSIDSNAKLKNVVLNFPKPADFEYDYVKSTTDTDEVSNYAWGYGALSGGVQSTTSFENVYVVSKFPLYHSADGKSDTTDGTDWFLYGENETALWHSHTADGGKTLDEIAVDLTSGETSHAKRAAGVRRYDSVSAIVSDTSQRNVDMLNALKASTYFKVVDNQILWFDHKTSINVDTDVNYEASTGVLSTSQFPTELSSVTVNGILLTEDNGGLIKNGTTYTLRAKTSADDTLAGVPYVLDGGDQVLRVVVDCEDKVYTFSSVIYWTDILTTASDVDKYFNLGTYDPTENPLTNNDRFIALGNNIDMSTMGSDYVIRNNCRYNVSGTWTTMYQFNGVFDGQGYAIKNAVVSAASLDKGFNHSYGFFGSVNGATVRNVALINLKSYLAEGETRTQYGGSLFYDLGGNSLVENLYVTLNKDSCETMPIIYTVSWTKAKFTNVVVEDPCADGWVWNDDKYATVSVGGYKMGYGVMGGISNLSSESNNVYVISPKPIFYVTPSSKPAAGTAHLSNGWGDNDSETNDYFFYGVNESKLWYTHTVLDTLDPDNAGKHTVQTVSAKNATGKARVLSCIRRYDNATALNADTSAENVAGLQKLVNSGYFKVDGGVLTWAR